MPNVLQRLDALAPIDLQELEAHASLQDRVDVKYVLTLAQLDVLLARLDSTHRVLEIDGVRSFGYRTTYYDTVDLVTFREHMQQRRRRFKCRKRLYLDSGRSVFEVKLKGPRGRTVKHAIPSCANDDELGAGEAAFLNARLFEAYGRQVHERLRPTLTATCRRSTIVACELGERLTCDLELDFGSARLDRRLAIIESKSPRGGAAVDRLLRELGARPVHRFSKYLLGMALTRDGLRDNDLRSLLRRYFVCASGPVAGLAL